MDELLVLGEHLHVDVFEVGIVSSDPVGEILSREVEIRIQIYGLLEKLAPTDDIPLVMKKIKKSRNCGTKNLNPILIMASVFD